MGIGLMGKPVKEELVDPIDPGIIAKAFAKSGREIPIVIALSRRSYSRTDGQTKGTCQLANRQT